VDDGILIPISADDADVILADDVAPVDDMMLVPLSAVDADGATGIMIPMLVGGADGATVDGWISVDDTNCISVDGGSVGGADDALVDEKISVGGGELELLALVPFGGGVVDAVALIVPVGAGTC